MSLSRRAAVTAACISATSSLSDATVLRGQGRLEAWGSNAVLEDMRPEIVADLFREVEHSWLEDRVAALAGTNDVSEVDLEAYAKKSMVQSCSKVANSIVQGSSGDERRVKEYMRLVCKRLKVNAEANSMCSEFGEGIVTFMRGDAMWNRNELKLDRFCSEFYEAAVLPGADKLKAEMAEKEKEDEMTATTTPVIAPVTTMAAHEPAPDTPTVEVAVLSHFGSRLTAEEDVAADEAEEKITVHSPVKAPANATSAETKAAKKTEAATKAKEAVTRSVVQQAAILSPGDEEDVARMAAAMPGH